MFLPVYVSTDGCEADPAAILHALSAKITSSRIKLRILDSLMEKRVANELASLAREALMKIRGEWSGSIERIEKIENSGLREQTKRHKDLSNLVAATAYLARPF